MPPAKKRQKTCVPSPLPSVGEAEDRAGISQRGVALIASDVLQDFGGIAETDTSQVVE